jgi:hypothetical protein
VLRKGERAQRHCVQHTRVAEYDLHADDYDL